MVRQGIRSLLAGDLLEICGEAENGRQAVDRVQELRPDLVILDITMPVMNGLEAAREIRKLRPSTKIILCTMHDSAILRGVSRENLADAVVIKSAAANELVATIRHLLPPPEAKEKRRLSKKRRSWSAVPTLEFRAPVRCRLRRDSSRNQAELTSTRSYFRN